MAMKTCRSGRWGMHSRFLLVVVLAAVFLTASAATRLPVGAAATTTTADKVTASGSKISVSDDYHCMHPMARTLGRVLKGLAHMPPCKYPGFEVLSAWATTDCEPFDEGASEPPTCSVTFHMIQKFTDDVLNITTENITDSDEWHDALRYSFLIRERKGKRKVDYLGFDKMGYSTCCNFLRYTVEENATRGESGSAPSPHMTEHPSISPLCEWEDLPANEAGSEEPAANSEESQPESGATVKQVIRACPLVYRKSHPQFTAVASDGTMANRSGYVVYGNVTKVLPSSEKREWTSRISLYTLRTLTNTPLGSKRSVWQTMADDVVSIGTVMVHFTLPFDWEEHRFALAKKNARAAANAQRAVQMATSTVVGESHPQGDATQKVGDVPNPTPMPPAAAAGNEGDQDRGDL